METLNGEVDREKFYTVWENCWGTWCMVRTYSGAFFLEGSGGYELLSNDKYAICEIGTNPNDTL